MQTFRLIRRTVAAILLVLYLPGCYHYVPLKGATPQAYIATKHPKQVRVTLTDSSQLVLRKPWVSADSLGEGLTGVTVPLSSVRRMEISRLDVSKTISAFVLIGGGIGVAWCILNHEPESMSVC